MSEIAYTYDGERNPDKSFIPGVPLRDLTVEEVQSMPRYVHAGVAQQPFYLATAAAPALVEQATAEADASEQKPTEQPAPEAETAGATPAAVVSARRSRPGPSETKEGE
mgnify:CR=1 FL=1